MAQLKKPLPNLRRFGEGVDKFREQKGWTRQQLADMIPISNGFLGQILQGKNKCSLQVAEKLDELLEANGEILAAWKMYVADSMSPRAFADFEEYEATAEILRAADMMFVNGLFQTEDYARALVRTEDALLARMARQAKILGQEHPPKIFSVMEEGVFYRGVGSRKIMRAQLEHILVLSEREEIYTQVAPFGRYKGVDGTFAIATQPDNTSVAFLANNADGETVRGDGIISRQFEAFGILQARALNVEDSRVFIRKVIEERWT
ncbi:hypothetical protein BTM25_02320 [Actinomadura rubteroloni]|uniref:HTH cro/C1-type domain-containing protein n=1 Tax=Actinomadura rubteroloni TaxID=1926885 RepID=A0A2P4ULH3_9ACTN|nr:helix-turn-helix transcriptional regulator [Actinomadura rubteroloni]POM25849.1 hypothetical protein BTM25_02320 [Actinomadura rubteroloni]